MTYEAEAEKTVVRPAWFVFLDIKDDPLRLWTGPMGITLSATGDTPLNGNWSPGSGLVDIGEIVEDENGSGPTRLEMSAVDPAQPAFKQIIADGRLWRRRRAIIWLSYINEAGALAFTPRRKKTGRLDDLRMSQGVAEAIISINIEGFAARSGEALGTKYSEQRDIDPSDKSQDWVHDLANKSADIGQTGQGAATGGGGGNPGGSGATDPRQFMELR